MLRLERTGQISAPKLGVREIAVPIHHDLGAWVICGNVTTRYHSRIEFPFGTHVCSRIEPKVDECLEIR